MADFNNTESSSWSSVVKNPFGGPQESDLNSVYTFFLSGPNAKSNCLVDLGRLFGPSFPRVKGVFRLRGWIFRLGLV